MSDEIGNTDSISEAIVEKPARAISAHFDIEYTPGEFEPHARAADIEGEKG